MTDIVERLRHSVTKGREPSDQDAIDAVTEIEQLRAALNTICGITLGSAPCDGGGKIHKIAVAALSTSDRVSEP